MLAMRLADLELPKPSAWSAMGSIPLSGSHWKPLAVCSLPEFPALRCESTISVASRKIGVFVMSEMAVLSLLFFFFFR